MLQREFRIDAPLEAGPFQIRQIHYPPGLRQPDHSHDAFSMTVLLAGALRCGETTTSEIEDRILDAVAAWSDGGSAGAVSVKPGWVERVKEALDDELETEVGVRELARGVGLTRFLRSSQPAGGMLPFVAEEVSGT